MPRKKAQSSITRFKFKPGHLIGEKYEVLELLGAGVEGEVYKVREQMTGILRAAKLFFPHNNPRNRNAILYARKLSHLNTCPIIIHYHAYETVNHQGVEVSCLLSEYVEGELLSDFINRQPGSRIGIFRGLHLLHALAAGLETMHNLKLYHGDIHSDNIIVKRYGLGFDLKVMDMHQWSDSKRENMAEDILNSIHVFYEAIGGQKRYAKHPPEIKAICLGLKRSLILKKFRSAAQLKKYLENIEWESSYQG